MRIKATALAMILCLSASGCMAAAAVDLAGTAVLTTAKVGVKATGAVAGAAIPDGDKDEKKNK